MKVALDSFQFDQLLEIAHLALDERMIDEAQQIFNALAQLRPTNPHPRIGLALLIYSERALNESIAALESILQDFPQAVFTRALLARLMREAGCTGWQTYAREALAISSSGIAAEMASALLSAEGESDGPPLMPPSLPASMPGQVAHNVVRRV